MITIVKYQVFVKVIHIFQRTSQITLEHYNRYTLYNISDNNCASPDESSSDPSTTKQRFQHVRVAERDSHDESYLSLALEVALIGKFRKGCHMHVVKRDNIQ